MEGRTDRQKSHRRSQTDSDEVLQNYRQRRYLLIDCIYQMYSWQALRLLAWGHGDRHHRFAWEEEGRTDRSPGVKGHGIDRRCFDHHNA